MRVEPNVHASTLASSSLSQTLEPRPKPGPIILEPYHKSHTLLEPKV
jgi:hypothetical protein